MKYKVAIHSHCLSPGTVFRKSSYREKHFTIAVSFSVVWYFETIAILVIFEFILFSFGIFLEQRNIFVIPTST